MRLLKKFSQYERGREEGLERSITCLRPLNDRDQPFRPREQPEHNESHDLKKTLAIKIY